ncbi:unnamed protein product, partial [marine sediment metagenome]
PEQTAAETAPIGMLRPYLDLITKSYTQWQEHISERYKDDPEKLERYGVAERITGIKNLRVTTWMGKTEDLVKEYIKKNFPAKTEEEVSSIYNFIFGISDLYRLDDEPILRALVKDLLLDGRTSLAYQIIEKTLEFSPTDPKLSEIITPLLPYFSDKEALIRFLPPVAQHVQSLKLLLEPLSGETLTEVLMCADTLFSHNSCYLKRCSTWIGMTIMLKFKEEKCLRENREIFRFISSDFLAQVLIPLYMDT